MLALTEKKSAIARHTSWQVPGTRWNGS